MDEHEFDALRLRSFGHEDAMRADGRARRATALGIALWGRNAADLERQLAAPRPEIPAGFDLADFRDLLRSASAISEAVGDPRRQWMHSLAQSSATVWARGQPLTTWEARCEVVRRAIEYLEKR